MKKYGLILLFIILGLSVFIWFLRQEPSEEILQEGRINNQYHQAVDWSKAGVDARRYQIDYQEVRDAVANGAKLYDARDAVSYQLGHVEFSENIPLMNLELGKLPDLDKETPIYVYCKTSICSDKSVKLFRQSGFQHVYDLGGLEQVEAIGGKIDW